MQLIKTTPVMRMDDMIEIKKLPICSIQVSIMSKLFRKCGPSEYDVRAAKVQIEFFERPNRNETSDEWWMETRQWKVLKLENESIKYKFALILINKFFKRFEFSLSITVYFEWWRHLGIEVDGFSKLNRNTFENGRTKVEGAGFAEGEAKHASFWMLSVWGVREPDLQSF